jgi:hypothetical protein
MQKYLCFTFFLDFITRLIYLTCSIVITPIFFRYHVTNFFAPSSRFGTPEDLKSLIDRAHELGLLVLMDIVHRYIYFMGYPDGPCLMELCS